MKFRLFTKIGFVQGYSWSPISRWHNNVKVILVRTDEKSLYHCWVNLFILFTMWSLYRAQCWYAYIWSSFPKVLKPHYFYTNCLCMKREILLPFIDMLHFANGIGKQQSFRSPNVFACDTNMHKHTHIWTWTNKTETCKNFIHHITKTLLHIQVDRYIQDLLVFLYRKRHAHCHNIDFYD